MEFLPGVPIAHPVPSLAFADYVEGYQASPVQDEVWNTVTVQ
jgi:peptide/nickel transport system substrate-binding protein